MENNHEELRAHLMATDEGFRRLAEQHAQLHNLLEAIEAKPYVTEQEEIEEHRLKKLKLNLKDQMNELLARHKHQPVG